MAHLLVSVCSPAEAVAALEGGAALIDIKEPTRGPLGRADAEAITAIVQTVAGRRPVSVAVGELLEYREPLAVRGVAYAKWGLAGCGGGSDWQKLFVAAKQTLPAGCAAVVVAYADWQAADAPPPERVCAWACEQRVPFLIDTWAKTGYTLLDCLSVDAIGRLCERCRRAGLMGALAGSLDVPQMEMLRATAPDWFAVRGAACRAGQRQQTIDPDRVRRLAQAAAGITVARSGN